MAPVPLNIVCLRYVGIPRPAGNDDGDRLDAMNREILMRIQERGIAVPSSTILQGRFAIRVAITNHRSRREDFDALLAAMVQIGAEVAAGR
jgi:glutamate/tyrosine decarboxylase-like PLP-dependent enzyme